MKLYCFTAEVSSNSILITHILILFQKKKKILMKKLVLAISDLLPNITLVEGQL